MTIISSYPEGLDPSPYGLPLPPGEAVPQRRNIHELKYKLVSASIINIIVVQLPNIP